MRDYIKQEYKYFCDFCYVVNKVMKTKTVPPGWQELSQTDWRTNARQEEHPTVIYTHKCNKCVAYSDTIAAYRKQCEIRELRILNLLKEQAQCL